MQAKLSADNAMFGSLLRFALGIAPDFPFLPTQQEWESLFMEAQRQAVLGVLFVGVSRLKDLRRPPMGLVAQWVREAETIRQTNMLINEEARRLTALFEAEGMSTAILKGPANTRLYPYPESRQPGDIDIWVEGGQERVLELLRKMGLGFDEKEVFYHHVHLQNTNVGVSIEIHYRPSSGNLNQRTNRRLQTFLRHQLSLGTIMSEEGFRVPSMVFALTMQLAHIQRHVLTEGVGLRQVIDYYLLLIHSSDDEREIVSKELSRLGLYHVARALMWVLGEVFQIDSSHFLTSPDRRRGRWLLQRIMSGGNFGQYSIGVRQNVWRYFFSNRLNILKRIWFSPTESIYFIKVERDYWLNFFRRIPERIKYRTLSLRDISTEGM